MDVDKVLESLQYLGANTNTDSRKELSAIMGAKDRVSPRYITELDIDEIFVFGSNIQGYHYWRASKVAHDAFGAEHGIGNGLSGNAFAIPTTSITTDISNWSEDDKINKICDEDFARFELHEIKPYVDAFIKFASEHPYKRFYVTRIGCGYADISDWNMAPLLADALKLDNVYLPQSFLDVLFHNECTCSTPTELVPFKGTGVKNFSNEMEQRFSLYLNWLRKHQNIISEEKRLKVMDAVEKICGGIIRAIDLSLRGVPSSAFLSIKELMDKAVYPICERNNISLLSYADTTHFYRMRVEKDNWAKKDVDKYGMFHIPFSKRDMVKTQRYSVPGYPCLYLAEHIFGCWEELGRPNLNDCLISLFDRQKDFEVLDLRIPSATKWNSDDTEIIKTVILFPLIIACTFKSANSSATYKPEYIIPQLLLQYVKESAYEKNRSSIDKQSRVVYGIRYTSVNIPNFDDFKSDIFDFDSSVYDNYVIPVIDIKNDYCSKLSSLFKITKPICEEFERLDNVHKQDNTHTSSKAERYKNSIFGRLESILQNREMYSL